MKNRLMTILPLFFVLFIDTLGAAFIVPLLTPILIDPTTSILPAHSPAAHRNFLYGLILSIYSLAAFFASPILGDLSDRLGRKRVLLICLFGVFLGYIIFALGVITRSISLLIASRVIGGLTAGSMSAAQAAIIDISTPENKTTHIGYILLAISMGYMIGPLIAGTLSNPRWVSWFQDTTPLYVASIMSLLNILLLLIGFKETYLPQEKKPIRLLSGLSVFVDAFKMKNLRYLTFAFMFLQLGWSTFVQYIGLFLTLRFHFNANQVGLFLGCVGLGFTLAFCYLLNIIVKHFPLQKIAVTTISLMALMLFTIIMIDNELSAWLISIPAATGLAISFSVLTSLFSNQVSADKQGWVMGLTGAIGAFSFGITGLIAGVIVGFGIFIPIWFALICLLLSSLFAMKAKS